MSSFIQSKAHIDALVKLAHEGPSDRRGGYGQGWSFSYYDRSLRGIRWQDAQQYSHDGTREPEHIGDMLVTANVASVAHRYDNDDTLPGPIEPYWQQPYRYDRNARHLSAIEGLVALSGYEYQSCERDDWEGSEAQRFCAALRDRLIYSLPGFDEADTWSID